MTPRMDWWERNNSHTKKQLTHEELMTTRDEIDQIAQLLVDPKRIENCESKNIMIDSWFLTPSQPWRQEWMDGNETTRTQKSSSPMKNSMTTRDEIDPIDQLLVDLKNIENCESKI